MSVGITQSSPPPWCRLIDFVVLVIRKSPGENCHSLISDASGLAPMFSGYFSGFLSALLILCSLQEDLKLLLQRLGRVKTSIKERVADLDRTLVSDGSPASPSVH